MVLLLLHNVNLFVWTLLVDLVDVLLSLDQQFVADIFHISGGRSLFYLVSNHRIFHKDFVLKELLIQRHGLDR